MNVNAAEIERIVRDVLQTLAMSNSSTVATTSPAHGTDGSLTDSVISVASFRGLAPTIQSVRILPGAVVTPAARDWCRDRGLALVRGDAASKPSAPVVPSLTVASSTTVAKPETLFVAGSATWLSGLKKQLCPKQSHVAESQPDEASVIRSIGAAIRKGHATSMAIVASPHSALWQAARDEALRPAIVTQWSDLADILREVPTNVLIVPSQRWSIAGTSNIARRYLDHTRSRS